MLTADQIEALGDKAQQIVSPITEYLIEDIARRISQAGQLTSTASYQVWRLQQLGMSQQQVKKDIQKRLGVSAKQLEQLMTQSAEVGYNFDIKNLPHVQAVPFAGNQTIQQIVSAAVQMAQDDLSNMVQTIGFVGPDGKCQELTDAYQQSCDFAFQKVATGAQDYNSAIREATKWLAQKGIRTIDYESGVHTSLEAAVRRNVMGGLGLMQEQISKQNHDDLGCDGWEISAHAASAPDHEPIQGRQYSDAEYTALNNSLVRRIGTLNCGHAAFPIILGVSSPQYSEDELEEFRQENENGIDYEGKHYTMYEATQRQRKLERAIRYRKRSVLIDETVGDKDRLAVDQTKLVRLNDEYARFTKAAGLRSQRERANIPGFGPHRAPENTVKRVEYEGVAKKTGLVAEAAEKASHTDSVASSSTSDGRNYVDITGAWYPDAVRNSHPVRDLQEYVVNGVTYKVDGRNVQLKYAPHEKEIAELLAREVGGEIYMVPKVNNPQGISTPDYLFHGKGYDLKTIGKTTGKNPLFNRIKKAKGQARNFILDITNSELAEDVIDSQIDKVFWSKETQFVNEVVIVRDGKIIKVVKRA